MESNDSIFGSELDFSELCSDEGTESVESAFENSINHRSISDALTPDQELALAFMKNRIKTKLMSIKNSMSELKYRLYMSKIDSASTIDEIRAISDIQSQLDFIEYLRGIDAQMKGLDESLDDIEQNTLKLSAFTKFSIIEPSSNKSTVDVIELLNDLNDDSLFDTMMRVTELQDSTVEAMSDDEEDFEDEADEFGDFDDDEEYDESMFEDDEEDDFDNDFEEEYDESMFEDDEEDDFDNDFEEEYDESMAFDYEDDEFEDFDAEEEYDESMFEDDDDSDDDTFGDMDYDEEYDESMAFDEDDEDSAFGDFDDDEYDESMVDDDEYENDMFGDFEDDEYDDAFADDEDDEAFADFDDDDGDEFGDFEDSDDSDMFGDFDDEDDEFDTDADELDPDNMFGDFDDDDDFEELDDDNFEDFDDDSDNMFESFDDDGGDNNSFVNRNVERQNQRNRQSAVRRPENISNKNVFMDGTDRGKKTQKTFDSITSIFGGASKFAKKTGDKIARASRNSFFDLDGEND